MPLYDTNKVAIIRYHFVHDENTTAYPNIRAISTNMFKMQLDFMQEHFRIITMDHLINATITGRTLPPNAAILTFDDGYIDHFTNVFPLLSDR
ncbi:MAG: polysaccharide deacetylase, partial [Clostridiales bacterium]|nr:polysaccharide deacetylase [Clostridiales bacterium]